MVSFNFQVDGAPQLAERWSKYPSNLPAWVIGGEFAEAWKLQAMSRIDDFEVAEVLQSPLESSFLGRI